MMKNHDFQTRKMVADGCFFKILNFFHGGDAAENRKFETGNVALLGSKNFQHLMFNEYFKFFKLKIYGGDAAENRKFESGNVALLGNKNFQHLMFNLFNENFIFVNFLKLKVSITRKQKCLNEIKFRNKCLAYINHHSLSFGIEGLN